MTEAERLPERPRHLQIAISRRRGSTASSHQTVDVTGVRETSFFEVTTQTNKYQVKNVTDDYLPYLDEVVIQGDVNGDGSVTIIDVTALIDSLLTGGIAPANADVNGDNCISVEEYKVVKREMKKEMRHAKGFHEPNMPEPMPEPEANNQ